MRGSSGRWEAASAPSDLDPGSQSPPRRFASSRRNSIAGVSSSSRRSRCSRTNNRCDETRSSARMIARRTLDCTRRLRLREIRSPRRPPPTQPPSPSPPRRRQAANLSARATAAAKPTAADTARRVGLGFGGRGASELAGIRSGGGAEGFQPPTRREQFGVTRGEISGMPPTRRPLKTRKTTMTFRSSS